MDIRLLETIQNYPEVYEYITTTEVVTMDQLKDYLANKKGIKTGRLPVSKFSYKGEVKSDG